MTSSALAADSVTANSSDSPSFAFAFATLRVGVASASLIVPMASPSSIVAYNGCFRLSSNVSSSSSSKPSSAVETVMLAPVRPAGIVSLPLASV